MYLEFILLLFGLTLFFLLFFLSARFLTEKSEKTTLPVFSFPVSEEFRQTVENLLQQEIAKILEEFRKSANQNASQLLNAYQKESTSFIEELKRKQKEYFEALNKTLEQISRISKELENTAKEQIKISAGLAEQSQERFLKEVDAKIDLTSKIVQKDIAEVHKKLLESVNEFSQQTYRVLEDLQKHSQGSLSQIPKQINKVLENYISEVKKEIEDYKREKIKELDEKVYLALKKIAIAVLGKTIDLTHHQKIVEEALKKAEKEEFFS